MKDKKIVVGKYYYMSYNDTFVGIARVVELIESNGRKKYQRKMWRIKPISEDLQGCVMAYNYRFVREATKSEIVMEMLE